MLITEKINYSVGQIYEEVKLVTGGAKRLKLFSIRGKQKKIPLLYLKTESDLFGK